jgi:serine/threonine-protein kinase
MVLAGRYRLDQLIGRGGMGEVWRGADLALLRDVAVKVLLDGNSAHQYLTRFQREARVMARLQHPGITVVHDVGRQENHLFIVMELLSGRNLGAILSEHPGGLPVGRAVALAIQAADALAAAHAGGVVHRDLKPTNLFVLPGDWLKICDFGIARDVGAASLTLGPDIFGTPAYMSPEQWNGEAVDPRSDLYSLGCVMYTMLTGRPPFPVGQPLPALMYQHLTARPVPLHHINHAVPGALGHLVLSLLAKNRDDRPAAAGLVAATLRRIQPATTQPGDSARAYGGPRTVTLGAVPAGMPETAGTPAPPVTAAPAPAPPVGPSPAAGRRRGWPWYAAGFLAAAVFGAYYLAAHAGRAPGGLQPSRTPSGSPTARQTPSKGGVVPAGAVSPPPAAVAKAGTSSVIAILGPDHSLDLYSQIVGATGWHRETVAGPGTTYSPPAITQIANSSVIAVQGPDHSLDYYWQQVGGAGWNKEIVAPANTTYSAPAVSQVGFISAIAAQGPGNSLDFYYQAIGTTGWSMQVVADAGTTYSPPSISQLVGLDAIIAAQGPGNSLDFYWATLGVPGWHPEVVADSGTTYSAPSVTQVGNSAAIAAEGPGHRLDYYWQPVATIGWNSQTVAGLGTTYAAPSLAQVASSAAIAVQGPANSLVFYPQATGPWQPQTVAGHGTTYSPPSIAEIGDSPVITADGPSGDVLVYQGAANSADWNHEPAAPPGSLG